MNKINIVLIILISVFITSVSAEEIKCKAFDLKCKTKQFIDDTKNFQKKGLEDGKNQIKKGLEGGKNQIKDLPEKLKRK